MCFGDAWVRKHDLSSLRVLGSVGESINGGLALVPRRGR
ncbi:acetyl-coenzyme A synthetase [Cutibacterium acnes JCM 18916]|nr:acetyl-coenzyme A synthetase [Cutibacterium acnes JCM 18916]